MKAVLIREPGNLEIIDQDPQPLVKDSVRLKMEAVGICGSDIALMSGSHPYAHFPVIPGHELAGRVLETAAQDDLETGQLVAVRPTLTCGTCSACREGRLNHCTDVQVLGVHIDGGMADELMVPAELIYRCSESMIADQAALVEPTAVALHACRRAGLSSGMSLAIIGSGVIGMLVIQIARSWGCKPILAIDRIAARLSVAMRLGADEVLDNRHADVVSSGRAICPDGFDVVMDMVGRGGTLTGSAALVRRGGAIIPVALPHGSIHFDFEPLYRKELTIAGSRLYDGDFGDAVSLIETGVVDPNLIITHHFPLNEAAAAFSVLAEQPEKAIKVIVEP